MGRFIAGVLISAVLLQIVLCDGEQSEYIASYNLLLYIMTTLIYVYLACMQFQDLTCDIE